jgi:hypothetical protein
MSPPDWSRTGRRRLTPAMWFLLLSLVWSPSSTGWASSPEDEAQFRSEWESVRKNYERTLRANQERIAEIYGRDRSGSVEQRAERIVKDRVGEAKTYLRGGGKGQHLAQAAERAVPRPQALGGLYAAQGEYLDVSSRDWGRNGVERRKLQEALALLLKNMELLKAHLAMATEATEATATRMQQSGVLRKAADTEAAAREALERLAARWERERAAREREREQREREAGERARGRP